jgi:uncharacterized protein YcbK (DUF882 family)
MGLLLGSMLPVRALAAALKKADSRRTLAFYNTHTAERLRVCYYHDGTYSLQSLEQINHILRDHRTDDIKAIDPFLLDQLFAIRCRLRPEDPFHVISGYRSPQTNELLRRTTSGVVRRSFHIEGRAIDIRLPHISTRRLRNCCIALRAGGVGYYQRSDFVHIDTGPVRSW